MNIRPDIMKEDIPLSTMTIVNEAVNRGIQYEVIVPKIIVLLRLDNNVEYLFCQATEKTTYMAGRICQDKNMSKLFLNRSGVKTAHGKVFKKNDLDTALTYARELGWPVVLKPNLGRKGINVFADVNSEDNFIEKWKRFDETEDIIVEQKFSGTEYRVWATSEKVYGITNRVPANVVGDGSSTIDQLITEKNSDENRGSAEDPTPLHKIVVDQEVKSFLSNGGKTLETVPASGEQVFLRSNSNLSTGGDSIESLDIAHSSVLDIAVKAVKAVPGLAYAGVDFMTKDITKLQNEDDYVIIELNHLPGINGHHFPAVGEPRNIAKVIIDMIFPETNVEGAE